MTPEQKQKEQLTTALTETKNEQEWNSIIGLIEALYDGMLPRWYWLEVVGGGLAYEVEKNWS